MLLETGLGQERKEAWGLAGLEELRMERRASGSGSEEGAWGFSTHLVGNERDDRLVSVIPQVHIS